MKIMITMNMPNSSGMPLHKLIAEAQAENIGEVYQMVCDREFILVNQYYVTRNQSGDTFFDDLGPMILNTYHIAKIQAYVEKEVEEDDRPQHRNHRTNYRR